MMPLEKQKDVLQLFMNQIDDHQPGKCNYCIVFILAMGMCNVYVFGMGIYYSKMRVREMCRRGNSNNRQQYFLDMACF